MKDDSCYYPGGPHYLKPGGPQTPDPHPFPPWDKGWSKPKGGGSNFGPYET